MKDYNSNSFTPEFCHISNEQRLASNDKSITKGNHKSTMEIIEILHNQVLSEIQLGF